MLDALREHLQLTGTRKGCDHGQCGACTVLVEGRRINACLALAVMHEGDEITTVEGLASSEDEVHPWQDAFITHDAFKCGFCTSGQLCSALGMRGEIERGEPSIAGGTNLIDLMKHVLPGGSNRSGERRHPPAPVVVGERAIAAGIGQSHDPESLVAGPTRRHVGGTGRAWNRYGSWWGPPWRHHESRVRTRGALAAGSVRSLPCKSTAS